MSYVRLGSIITLFPILHANMSTCDRDAINGWDPSGGAIYYFNPNTATNSWIWSRPLIKTIGKHRFCK